MKMSFRWYGKSDPISLEYISQIPGMHSVVSAVYDVKPGEVWPEESLAKIKADCEAHGLVFDVVESIPVSEDIKLGTEKRDEHIGVYCENIRRLAEAGIDTSVGSVGDSYDNALAESIIGLFKTEVIKFLGPWKSVGQVEWETLKWVDWYNKTRLHSAIGYVTPNEAEEEFYTSLNAAAKAA